MFIQKVEQLRLWAYWKYDLLFISVLPGSLTLPSTCIIIGAQKCYKMHNLIDYWKLSDTTTSNNNSN